VSDLLDVELARRVATAGVGAGPAAMPGLDLESIGARAADAVLTYTDLQIAEPLPEAEWIDRRGWIELNLSSMGEIVDAVASRAPGLAGGRLGAVTSRVIAVEIGALLNFASRHVLGQYDLSLLGEGRPPRLVFVGANISDAAGKLGGDSGQVLEWIALHEVTHAVHLGSAPWIRTHLGALARTLLANAEVGPGASELLARARRIATTDPRRALDELRASDPLTLLATAESAATIRSIQAVMAAIEGYAEHVMDAAGAGLGPAVAQLRLALDRRRENRNPVARLLAWILGFELKMRQYRDGKSFCDAVVARVGIDGLNRAWAAPDALPELAELGDPDAWIERVALPSASL